MRIGTVGNTFARFRRFHSAADFSGSIQLVISGIGFGCARRHVGGFPCVARRSLHSGNRRLETLGIFVRLVYFRIGNYGLAYVRQLKHYVRIEHLVCFGRIYSVILYYTASKNLYYFAVLDDKIEVHERIFAA